MDLNIIFKHTMATLKLGQCSILKRIQWGASFFGTLLGILFVTSDLYRLILDLVSGTFSESQHFASLVKMARGMRQNDIFG